MTTFEHALLAIDGVLASGLQRRYGWQLAGVAAVAAVSPDWDGLVIAFSLSAFAAGHRVWGHNLWACLLGGAAIGSLDYRFDGVTRAACWLDHTLRVRVPTQDLQPRQHFTGREWWTWTAVGSLAALSHLLGDLLVSGAEHLPDWELRLLWPISARGWVFPLVRWGDPGISIIFVIGMFAMLRWKSHCAALARATLVGVALYLAARGGVLGRL